MNTVFHDYYNTIRIVLQQEEEMLHVKVAGIIKLIYKNILNIFILLLSMLLLLEGKQANHSLPRWNEQNDRSSITSFSVFRCNFCVRVCFRLHTKIPLMYVFLHQGGFFYCVSSISMKFQDNHSNSMVAGGLVV